MAPTNVLCHWEKRCGPGSNQRRSRGRITLITHRKAAASALVVAAASGEAHTVGHGPAAELNLKYNSDLQSAMARILDHPKFQGITTKFGVPGASLDLDKYKNDLGTKGFHRFEGNVFMVALQSYDDAPASRARTVKWMDKHYDQATGNLPDT